MIDQDKMRALAAETRHMADVAVELGWNGCAEQFTECADAIDLLLAEVEAEKQSRGHAQRELELSKLQTMGANSRVEILVKLVENIRAELEAAAADKRDGHRYRELLGLLLAGDIPMPESSVSLNVCGVPPNQDEFDEAVDFLLAQRQGEGS